MAYESFSVSEVVPAEPARVYAAWLSSEEHTAFTGDDASIEPFVGGKHSTFGGYSIGNTLELHPGARIVLTWRAEDFPPGTPDSRVEVTLEATVGGTMVTIFHTEIPTGFSDGYRDGWLKYYLEPLKKYFGAPPAKAQVAAKSNGVSTSAPAKPKPASAKPKAAAKAKAAPRKKAKIKAKAKGKPAGKKKPAIKTKAKTKPATKKPKPPTAAPKKRKTSKRR